MAGIDCEGFDWLPTGATATQIINLLSIDGRYFSPFNPVYSLRTPGRLGYGNSLFISPSNIEFWSIKPFGSHNSAGGWVSAGLHIIGSPANFGLCVFDAVNNIVLISVVCAANGIVKVFRGSPGSGVLIGASDPGVYDNNVDFDMEVFFKVHSTTGEVEVRLDEISVVHLVSVNTQPGTNAYFDSSGFIGSGGVTVAYAIDDMRYYDTTGANNNTWLGTRRVQVCLPGGDGAHLDFTRSNTGLASWQNMANRSVDDTLYLFDATTGHYSLATVTPLVNSPTVDFLKITGFYRQDDATQRYVKNRLVSGGSTFDGTSFATPSSYQSKSDILELDPATGLSFTGAAVNALSIGPLDFA